MSKGNEPCVTIAKPGQRTTDPVGMKKALRFLGITFLVLLISTICIWGFQTDWGKVKIERQNITAEDGSTVSMLVYTPSTATADNPAPGVVINHGRSNQAHSNDTWSMELARRGYVVVSPDLFGGGESTTGSRNEQSYSATKYLTTLPNVDTDNINLIGYSAGCGTSLNVAQRMPDEINSVLTVFGPFITLMAHNETDFDLSNLQYDFGMVKSTADQYDYYFFGDPETTSAAMAEEYGVDQLVSGEYTTNSNGYIQYYREVGGTLHQTGNISGETITAIVDFEQEVSPAPNELDSSDQSWLPQQIFSGIAAIAMMFLFVALIQTLMEMPFFAPIRNPRPGQPRKGAGPWILDLILGILIPTVLFVPVSAYFMVWAGPGTPLLNIFTSTNFNGIIGWLLVAIALIGIIRIAVTAYMKKKQGGKLTLADLCLAGEGETKLRASAPLKAFLIGVIVMTAIFVWLWLVEGFLGINYQVWNLADYCAASPERILRSIPYVIVIFIVMMIGCSAQRILPSTGNERLDTWIGTAVDTVMAALPLLILLVAQYGGSLIIGTGETVIPQIDIYGTGKNTSSGALDFAFGYCYMMGGTTGAVSYLFRKYGNIWIGVIPAAIFAGMVTLMSFTLAL